MRSNIDGDLYDFLNENKVDEVLETQLLGPNGKPYAIKRPKMRMGFDTTPRKG